MLSSEEQQQSRPDAELTASIREGDDEALAELYRRHQPAVLAYARTCCRDPHTAEDLASEAFTRALQAVRSGGGPELAWRAYLLTIVRRTAAGWADTARRTELAPDFTTWLAGVSSGSESESSEERVLRLEDNSLVLRGFRTLPERWRAVLWHTVIEDEPAAEVAARLGMTASGVASLAARAREGLREAYLSAHADSSTASEECRRHTALLGAVVRRSGRRTSRALDRHLTHCARCRRALVHLTDINERLNTTLPAALLLWGGSAYVAAGLRCRRPWASRSPPSSSQPESVGWPCSPTPPSGPSSRSPEEPNASRRGRTSASARPSPTHPSPGHTPTTTGGCMEIPGDTPTPGVQPREATCDGSARQHWNVVIVGSHSPSSDLPLAQLRNKASGLYLSSAGSTAKDAPVVQRTCDTDDPSQIWAVFDDVSRGVASFIDRRVDAYLGLEDGRDAAAGRPHDPTIGTNTTSTDDEDAPCSDFRYDGTPFGSG
ncbi:sigma-70 family RNA polymerase sigma factor [Streptomyces sp. BPTC-684]|uniref:sigma-70 family RNA polymerase sigma factor n=1 Tax=Streptomyces sp. BPTC-684 TaxID=3043734 RepID=UPI0024B06707|nr:sigma-70 family RNA polymerase sigma factor [Streptomyces sp. BPTC-684]WHM40543.1 sigma-70 family RNA polymerase sigma factor [Streptomyces sp. BPTC-684]